MENEAISQCTHFVARKKRHCRMSVKPGHKYCGEHKPAEQSEEPGSSKDTRIRIVCPLDSKHTCFAHNLKKHLTICNARPGITPHYIQKDINSGNEPNEIQSPSKLLSTFSVNDIVQVIAKVNKSYDAFVTGKITTRFTTHQIVEDEMQKPEYGEKTKKHLTQASAILGLLTHYQLMTSAVNTCYIEFGAGRGHLSYWIAKATEEVPQSSFLLVDRTSPKHKRDNKLDKTDDKVQRLRADIADLVIDKLETISKTAGIVAVTKHLCGEATDLAIRCLTNTKVYKEKVLGCIMTFCCHHRCRWSSYTGKKFFEECGLTKNDFDMMSGMSSWATCGSGFSRKRKNDMNSTELDKEAQSLRDQEIGLDRSQKKDVGEKCKGLLNWGRLQYLESLGFTCHLHYYVAPEISLENVCVVAHRTKS